jgi:transcriptional antiterminator NusG
MKSEDEKPPRAKWFSETSHWYVHFVQTQTEERVVSELHKKLDPDSYFVFCPTKDYAFKKQGKTTKRRVPWLSSYVFVAATVEANEFLETIRPLIQSNSDVYRLLSNDGEPDNVELSSRDKAIMTAILDEDFNIPALAAIMIDDKVKIIDGALDGFGGRVTRINKHKQTATIEMNLFNTIVPCEVMLEFIMKSPELPE